MALPFVPALPAVGAVLLFFLLWCGIIFLVSRFTGWAALAEVYPLSGEATGERWSFQTAYMRWWSHYGNCLIVTAGPRGLGLTVLWPFRIGHSPLLIPWEEISSRPASFLGFPFVELRFLRVPSIPFRIRQTLARRLAPFLPTTLVFAAPRESANSR